MSTSVRVLFSLLISFLYSLANIIVGPMTLSQDFTFKKSSILPFLICFIVCSIANFVVLTFVPKLRFKRFEERLRGPLDRLGDRRLFFIVWLFIFIMWVPAFLLTYPGVLSYDSVSQTSSALTVITSNHHPVLHNWLLRVFLNLGHNHLSGYESGLGLLSLVQMIVLSYALARLILLIKRKNVPLLIVFAATLFSALWFVNAVLSVTMVKDTLHGAFFVLFACHFAEMVTAPSEYVSRKINLFVFPIVAFLMFATRNNGFHIYLFCFVLLGLTRISCIRHIKPYTGLMVAIVVPVVLFKLYSGPFFAAMGIEQGEVREALSLPTQQLQRVSALKYNELTDEQREVMRSYIIDCPEWMGYENNRAYDPFFADPAKSCFYSAHYNDTKADFWKFYLATGRQFSKTYIEAFLSNTLGFWYPGQHNWTYVVWDNYAPEEFMVPLERKSILNVQWLDDFYDSLCNSDNLRDIPVLRFFFVPGFSMWILIFAVVLSWKKKGFLTKSLPLLLPLIAQFGIMILSPMASFRYSWPIYIMLPLACLAIWGKTDSEFSLDDSSVA